MVTVAKLNADVTANTSSFETAFKRADKRIQDSTNFWGKQLNKANGDFNLVGKGVMGLAGQVQLAGAAFVAFATGGVAALIKGSIDAASAISDTAQRLQITTDALQEYQYAAKLAGLSNEEFESAITKLNAKLADGDLKYKSTTEAISSIAEAVKNASTDFERAAIINDAFGNKMGAKLLPLFIEGADGLRKLGDEAQRTGNVIGGDVIRQSEALGDQIDILLGTISKNIQGGFLEVLVDQTGDLRDIYADPQFAANIIAVGKALGFTAQWILQMISNIGWLITKYQELDKAGKKYLEGVDRKLLGDDFVNANNKFKGAAPGGAAAGVPATDGPNGLPYVSTEANKAAEAAAKAAARAGQVAADKKKELINSLRQESLELTNQVMLYGQKEGLLAKEQRALAIRNQLNQAGLKLTKDQQAQVDMYLDAIEDETDKLAELEKAKKRQEEADRDRQQAMTQLASTMESAFEDAILKGEDLADVLEGLANDIAKLIIRKNITEPLFAGITSGDGGGLFGDIFGGLFGGGTKPSHAGGLLNVPSDMTARIHKGEMIVPAKEADQIRRGGGGGSDDLTVNIINNAGAKVSTSKRDTGNGAELEIMIDELVASKMSTPGSKTNMALGAYSGRGLTRR